jgi:DNA-binding NarL/FixJ family response regulator
VNRARILIVDDHAIVRRGVRALLEAQPELEIVGEASTGRAAVEMTETLRPDVVVLDLSLPELHGLEVTRRISADFSGIQVLVLTMHHSEELARQVRAAGARAFVLKSDADQDLVAAVTALRKGETFFSSTVTGAAGGDGTPAQITPREREIIQLVAEGQSTKEIAAQLDISIKTVESHRTNIMRKLGLRSMSEMVRFAIRNGIVQA